jgi:hypothetical protein
VRANLIGEKQPASHRGGTRVVRSVRVKSTSAPFAPAVRELEASLDGATAAEIVRVAQEHVRIGNPSAVLSVCEAARVLGHDDPGLSLSEAMAHLALGAARRALELVDRVLESSPEHVGALHIKAHTVAALGRPSEARGLLGRVIERYPDYPGAQAAMAALVFPGPHYRQVLAAVHRALAPTTYLEIGVETGATLALAGGARVAAGIDPDPSRLTVRLPPTARVYSVTSDEFFRKETRASVFGGAPVELAFIDGMHWFEYALRDFVNVEKWCGEGSTVLLHDCLPATAVAARRERASTFWVGDVWKVLECLLDHRTDLRIAVVAAPPSGLVVVRGLDPASTVLEASMDSLVARYAELEYPHVPGEWPERYRVVRNDAAGLGVALGGGAP